MDYPFGKNSILNDPAFNCPQLSAMKKSITRQRQDLERFQYECMMKAAGLPIPAPIAASVAVVKPVEPNLAPIVEQGQIHQDVKVIGAESAVDHVNADRTD